MNTCGTPGIEWQCSGKQDEHEAGFFVAIADGSFEREFIEKFNELRQSAFVLTKTRTK
jgi:hypothetical protein